jgi:hypothetical protein
MINGSIADKLGQEKMKASSQSKSPSVSDLAADNRNVKKLISIDDIFQYSPELFFGKINPDLNPADFSYELVQKGYTWSCDRRIITHCENPEINKFYVDLQSTSKKLFLEYIQKKFPTSIALLNFISVPKITERGYERRFDRDVQQWSNYSFFYDLSGTLLVPKKINGINLEKEIDRNVRTTLKSTKDMYK